MDMFVPVMMKIDVEIKLGWVGEFTFPTIHIPARKVKFLKWLTQFWVISGDGKRMLQVDGWNLKKEFLVEVPNKYVESGEKFYAVPKNLAREVVL